MRISSSYWLLSPSSPIIETGNEHLIALLLKITQAPARNRSRRNSRGTRMLLSSVSEERKQFLAWCCPDYFDEDLGSQSFLVHIQDPSFIYPHNKLCINRIKEDKSFVFSLNLKLAREESRLQKWVIGHSESVCQWAYISADAFSALSSKGKSIQLPWSVPSASSGFSCNTDVPDSGSATR